MTIAIFWLLFAVVVGVFASNRGRSGFGWFLLSALISPLLGLIFCAVSKDLSKTATLNSAQTPSQSTHRRCPACAEFILPEATVCKHCATKVEPDTGFYARRMQAIEDAETEESRSLLIVGGIVVAVLATVFVFVK